jgi:hypothetical protein
VTSSGRFEALLTRRGPPVLQKEEQMSEPGTEARRAHSILNRRARVRPPKHWAGHRALNNWGPSVAALLGAGTLLGSLQAAEGMWTLDNLPRAALKSTHGFEPDAAWLAHVQRAAVRVGGCSASIVSEQGLVMTNHHCVTRCLTELSTRDRPVKAAGFLARKPRQALAPGKALFYRQLESGMEAAYIDAAQTMACNMMDESALEGVQAFIDKRSPNWAPPH